MKLTAAIGMGKKSFLPYLKEKFGFADYHRSVHRNKPLFVRGCGSQSLKAEVMSHRGLAVIFWTGSDTLALHQSNAFLEYLKVNNDRIFHLAFSHWCKTDLDHFGIKYQHRLIIPISLDQYKYEPETKGKIYHYGNAKRTWYYGTDLVQKVERTWDAYHNTRNPEFIYTTYRSHSTADLQNLYKDSILGVRLTEHDGNAGSVLEMGLMGRRSIYNGLIPGAIPYMENPYTKYNPRVTSEWQYQNDDLVQTIGDLIQEELNERPLPDRILAEEMKEFTHDDLAWLDTKFYEG